MNPGYAGRSNLPENLTSLFRSVAMTTPDRLLIAQVMLFSQGFTTAEQLAQKVIPFFEIVKEQLSNQKHYDFGLRALKSVLSVAGKLKRTIEESEEMILVQSIKETVFPKLVKNDVKLAAM
jgi:dynein heavy chain 1